MNWLNIMDMYLGFDEFGGFDPWSNRREKSTAAERREQEARDQFSALHQGLEGALVHNTSRVIQLGCKDESPSLLGLLPAAVLNQVLEFVFVTAADTNHTSNSTSAVAASTSSATTTTRKNPTKNKKETTKTSVKTTTESASLKQDPEEESVWEVIKPLYDPGNVISFPLLTPDHHLTGPCWRDFSRWIRTHPGWNAKRTAATPQEKKEYKAFRQGHVYFVRVIYTVPGVKPKKKKPTKKRTRTACVASSAAAATTIGDATDPNENGDLKPAATVKKAKMEH